MTGAKFRHRYHAASSSVISVITLLNVYNFSPLAAARGGGGGWGGGVTGYVHTNVIIKPTPLSIGMSEFFFFFFKASKFECTHNN